MKFSQEEKNLMLKLIKNEIYLIKNSTQSKEGDKKYILLNNIKNKIDNSSLSGASFKQIKSLNGVAKKKELNSKTKIQNSINLLLLYSKTISVYSVAKESGMSYNTVKKYKEMIKPYEKN